MLALLGDVAVEGHAVEDVIWGNVTQIGEQGGCLARSAVLMSDLDQSIPGLSINRFCASGMEAVNLAANQVKAGAGQAYIAGGVEMMGRVAMGSDGAAIAVDPSLAMKTYFVPQGISADIIATEYGFTREQADALAVESQRRAKQAWDEGRFAKSIVPAVDQNGLTILDRDEYMRPGTTMEDLAKLKPAFKDMGEMMPGFDKVAMLKYPHLDHINHIHHAGNSSGIVDGAAAVLIGSKEWGEAMGLKPRARIVATLGPASRAPGTVKALAQAGVDVFRLNFSHGEHADHAQRYQWVREVERQLPRQRDERAPGPASAHGGPLCACGVPRV